jgi:branched-chain amino acid transport system substrate-binding protein
MHRCPSCLLRLHPVRLLLFTLALLWVGGALALEPLRIGVVLPGRDSIGSAHWNELLTARAWERSLKGRRVGVDVELYYRDGGTTPGNTLAAIRDLVEQDGVHAVVCCVTAASAAGSAVHASTLPIFALERPNTVAAGSESPLVLEAGPLAQARAMTLDAREFGRGVGLMTLENSFGKEVAAAVLAGLVEVGLPLASAETYPPGAKVLTPEGLMVAASDPGSVIVWGLPADSLAAIEGLRERGYDGPIYLPWSVALAAPGGYRNARLRGVRVAVPPAALADELPNGHPNALAVERYQRTLAEAYGVYEPTAEGALAFDALELLLSAGQLAVVYGVDPGNPQAFRQAVRDALVGLGPIAGAAGSYDYDGRNPELALASGLVIATPESARLRPLWP